MTISELQIDEGFDHIESWVFDLDNTLYPASCDLFSQVDQRMGEFISRQLDLPLQEAKHLQKQYYRDYGTTMNGLMTEHGMAPGPFLDYVHDIDLGPVEPNLILASALGRLPGQKFVFTNGTNAHAANVLDRLGIAHHFDDVFDIVAADYVPKPARETYLSFLNKATVEARSAAMFEDLPRNLVVPHAIGMTTILVETDFHPDADMTGTSGPRDHIHHVTDDLGQFLQQLST